MILTWLALIAPVLFIVLSAFQAFRFGQMPLHARLELYPVPKEKNRGHYGGSYYEEVLWWQKPHSVSKSQEVFEMLKEMLFIKKLFQRQRKLWWMSYSLHLGIYCLVLWSILLMKLALLEISLPAWSHSNSLWMTLIVHFFKFLGAAGFSLATVGAIGLLLRRLSKVYLRNYTAPLDYINLLLIITVLISGIVLWWFRGFEASPQVVARALSFKALTGDSLLSVHIIMLDILLIYIPLGKMSHYVGKYFSFHRVLWENEANISGSALGDKIEEAVGHQPQWRWASRE